MHHFRSYADFYYSYAFIGKEGQ